MGRSGSVVRCVALAAIALCVALGPGLAQAGSVVYVAGTGNEFGTLNLSTGAFTNIGTLNLPGNDAIYGMGFGSDGKLYGLDASTPNANLYQINTSNASTSLVGAIGQSAIDATSDANGVMYGLSFTANSNFFTLNPASGTTTTVVGATGIAGSGLMAVSANGSQIFAGATDATTGLTDLYSINKLTGAATLIGNTGFYIGNGLFVNGTLYGFDYNSEAIVTINTTTGVATQVATYSLPGGDTILASALAPQAIVPEPSSIVMGLIAIGAGGLVSLHRRRASTRVA